MRTINIFHIIGVALIIFITPHKVFADFYFNSNCANNGNGTSWSCAVSAGGAGAWNDLPTNAHLFNGFIWERGNYWLAGSATSYSGTTFRRQSGSGRLTLKKATLAEHGTGVGWQSSYGTNQAVMSTVAVWISDVTIDGSYRSSQESGYGLKMQATGDKTLVTTANNIPMTGFIIKYVELTHTSYDASAGTAIFLFGNGNNLIQYVYAHDLAGLCFKGNKHATYNTTGGFENIIIENSVCGRIGRTTGTGHVELLKDDGAANNVTIRSNLFYDWRSTGGLVLGNGETNWSIYNNIFTQRTAGLTCGNGVITGLTAGSGWKNIKVYNNTFANIASLNSYIFVSSFGDMSGPGNEVKNNLFYNVATNPNTCTAGCTKANNWYSETPRYRPGPSEIAGTGDPFIDSGRANFKLTAGAGPIDQGVALSTYFTTDKEGKRRPKGSAWDIGAFEFFSGPTKNKLIIP